MHIFLLITRSTSHIDGIAEGTSRTPVEIWTLTQHGSWHPSPLPTNPRVCRQDNFCFTAAFASVPGQNRRKYNSACLFFMRFLCESRVHIWKRLLTSKQHSFCEKHISPTVKRKARRIDLKESHYMSHCSILFLCEKQGFVSTTLSTCILLSTGEQSQRLIALMRLASIKTNLFCGNNIITRAVLIATEPSYRILQHGRGSDDSIMQRA